MPLPARRSIVIISGLLTLLVLTGGTLAVALHNGWLRTAAVDVRGREPLAQNAIQGDGGVYQQKLEEAYRALDDAYAQIRALQSPQSPLVSARNDDDRFTEHDGDDDRRGRRSDRRRSHDD